MKTIAYRDLSGGGLKEWKSRIKWNQPELTDNPKHINRIVDGLNDLKHTGNIAVYLIRGTKIRLLFKRYL